MSNDVQLVALWGDDHRELGPAVVSRLDGRCAIALSRGRYPKRAAGLDPNEDAVLAAAGPGGRLLAVADGHSGFDAARAATAAVASGATPLLRRPPREPRGALRALLGDAERAVSAALAPRDGPRAGSRTALTVVHAGARGVHHATLGDTAAVRVSRGRAVVLGGTGDFLQPGIAAPAVARRALRAGHGLVLCSDGLPDFLGRHWARRVRDVSMAGGDAAECARRLVAAACEAGAGDNVAVAVLMP